MVWRLAEHGSPHCGDLLGSGRLATPALGAPGWIAGVDTSGILQLLERELLGWGRCRRGWRTRHRSGSTVAEESEARCGGYFCGWAFPSPSPPPLLGVAVGCLCCRRRLK